MQFKAALNNDKYLLDNVDPTQVAEFDKIIKQYKMMYLVLVIIKDTELLKTHVKDVIMLFLLFLEEMME